MRSALAATFLALVAALSATASITVSITKPQANQIVGDQLAIEATVTSTNQLQSVTATVADRNTALTFSNSKWTGSLSLAGLPHGNTTLTVTATDIFNNSQSAQRVFRHDTPPALTITAPLQDTVARPLVRITVTCTDDGPGGCQSLEVRLPDDTVLIEAVSSIDQYISLEDFDGTFVDLEIQTRSTPRALLLLRPSVSDWP
jgi:hypothetical protein